MQININGGCSAKPSNQTVNKSTMNIITRRNNNKRQCGDRSKTKGFTLIELLAVIGIIAILTGIVIVSINPVKRFAQARDSQRATHIDAIYSVIEQYIFLNNGALPTCFDDKSIGEFFDVKECEDDLTDSFAGGLPKDPRYETVGETGYLTKKDSLGRIGVEAYHYEGNERIVSGHWPQSCLDFNGSSDYADVGSGGSIGLTDYLTVSAWVYFNNVSDGTRVGNIVGNYLIDPHFNFEGHTTGRLRFYWDGGEVDLFGTKDLRGAWHHVIAVRNKTTNKITLYIDGIFESEKTAGTNRDIQWPLRIGGDFRATPGIPFNGLIDDIRIYDRALSEAEIKQLYDGKNITDGIAGHWPMNEGNECTAYDFSGNENHGTLEPCLGPNWTTDCK